MRGTLTLSCLLLVTASSVAVVQAQSIKISQHSSWGTYSHSADTGKVCYALTVPVDKQPPSLDHGDIYFMVNQRPGQNIYLEPQFVASYNFQEASKVSVTIAGKAYMMFTRGKSAWLENAAEESQFVAAMKAGSDMKVSARSGRGNETNYAFSLRGISAALDSIQSCQ